jgi:DNA polymerase-3 subunit delta
MIVNWKGDNKYQIAKSLSELKQKFDSFNLTVLPNPTLKELGDVVKQAPVFATQRLVVVLSSDKLESHPKKFEDEFNSIPNSTYLLFIGATAKVEGTVKKCGKVVEFKNPEVKQLDEFVVQVAQEYGVTFNKQSQGLFIFLVGNDEGSIRNEMSKLKGKVSLEDVSAAVSRHEKTNVFKLVENIVKGDLSKTNASLEQFLGEGQDPNFLVNLLIGHFRLLIQIKELDKKGLKKNGIAEKLNIHAYRAQLMLEQSQKFKPEQLAKIFALFEDLSFKVKIDSADYALSGFVFNVKHIMSVK